MIFKKLLLNIASQLQRIIELRYHSYSDPIHQRNYYANAGRETSQYSDADL